MGKIESIRLAPRRMAASNGNGNGAARSACVEELTLAPDPPIFRGDPEALLELLAAGDPPAFATDSRDRIVFWNWGMTELVGKRADEAMGQRCYETLAGRDVFGNRFCYANCPVVATVRADDAVSGFELKVAANGGGRRAVTVTILKVPGVRPDLFTLVHILQPLAEEGRLARLLERLGHQGQALPAALANASPAEAPPLTRREVEVLHHVAAGLQNKEVAQKLDLSLATVRNHIHSILDKLGVHSKLEAVSLAFRRGWISAQASVPAPPRSPVS
jgi:DNA-binding CsgD family transcriptional regulator